VRRGGTAYALIDELRRSGPGQVLLLNPLFLIGSLTTGRDVLRRVAGS